MLDWICIILAALSLGVGLNNGDLRFIITGMILGAIALFLDILDMINDSLDKEIEEDEIAVKNLKRKEEWKKRRDSNKDDKE